MDNIQNSNEQPSQNNNFYVPTMNLYAQYYLPNGQPSALAYANVVPQKQFMQVQMPPKQDQNVIAQQQQQNSMLPYPFQLGQHQKQFISHGITRIMPTPPPMHYMPNPNFQSYMQPPVVIVNKPEVQLTKSNNSPQSHSTTVTQAPVTVKLKFNKEERAKILARYREKRKRRNFRRVRYKLRKQIAHGRPRIGGRFVKKEKPQPTSPLPVSTSVPATTTATAATA
eukprot:CAMPEP_0204839038 /NCGR_PEP_ID=MMETSP1346-20131115/32846_1 /ASSEMBLY_ACC=CAM_ASM_000771 /TAXON_ID=215587 /ORGANISM="Aplanochytrium stocchinoi, Strain GSBS06" /LENGTH=224 /DNA_ID=CAMNT_0051975485 /DNA_START=294 /DNA_END=968 /DNA_ORIENTATION=+